MTPGAQKIVKADRQIVSKARVAGYGEVLTGAREVNAMLDMVKQETERIDSRFLEPACGDGNFLEEILRRKLEVVRSRYGRSQWDYERNAIVALGSVYGVDILADNAIRCRDRLLSVFSKEYEDKYGKKAKAEVKEVAKFVLSKNIVHGDALSLKTVGSKPEPITFSEWSPVNGFMVKRRDFKFQELLAKEGGPVPARDGSAEPSKFVPSAVADFDAVHFLKLAHV